MAEERENRLAALRRRVQEKVTGSRIESRRREKDAEDELVVQVAVQNDEIDLEDGVLSQGERRRSLASTMVLIGSLMGILSGILILQGNPSDLLESNLFDTTDALDIHGMVLDSEGDPIGNVTIELIDPVDDVVLMSNTTDENGRYSLTGTAVKYSILKFTLDDHVTVLRHFTPEPIGITPVTMLEGEGERIEDERSKTEGWSMQNAVALSSAIGLLTIATALVGVHASYEIKKAKRYRRTQMFCWIALFSRGLIIFGPSLILIAMILTMLDREDFEDFDTEED
ncbi:MAG: carboxypeptidase-like regulatory domain-containing protein [Candidatus Poseidoniaceae archaeon]|jgi:hypothetical protein|nr:carboxypeptidase-like regulatory domain-containing protein [Candidatus Poseidoniaceae archaeon]